VIEHLRVAGQKTTACRSSNAALDLHHGDRIVGKTSQESRQGSGGEMASALAFTVELRFPAALDIDHG
jgi:hypothetical protein